MISSKANTDESSCRLYCFDIQGFSKDAREIFEHFKFAEFIGQLADANLLFKVVQKVGTNETAGEHFTPRETMRIATSLVFMEDGDALTKAGIIRTLYDPTAGTGGFLFSGEDYVRELNPQALADAILDRNEAQQKLMLQLLADSARAKGFQKLVFDLLLRRVSAPLV